MNFKKLTTGTYIIIGIVTTLVTLVGVPAFVNYLMSVHVVKIYGDAPAWIGFLGTYIGSILSGAITLAGVFLTIKHSEKVSQNALKSAEKDARQDKLPTMIFHSEECIDYISACLENIRELRDVNIEELGMFSHERKLTLYIIDHNYNLVKTQEMQKYSKETFKVIRKHMIKIDANAYKHFRNFEHQFHLKFEEHLRVITLFIESFQNEILEKYMETHAEIITDRHSKLTDIELDKEDAQHLKDLKSDLYQKEKDFIRDLYFIYEDFHEHVIDLHLSFVEEFSG